MATSAGQLYASQLQLLPTLTPMGAAQLAADVEYFNNVLMTLGLAAPPALIAWQAAAGAPQEGLAQLKGAIAEGGEEGEEAAAVVELVAKLRGVAL